MTQETPQQQNTIIAIRPALPRHGGAWKVAYADFVTAMMAFFLLLWLLNVTTEEQKNAISNYFDPTNPKVSKVESGAGGVLGGLTMSSEGHMSANQTNLIQPHTQNRLAPKVYDKGKTDQSAKEQKKEQIREQVRRREEAEFKQAADKLRQAIESNPELKQLSKHLKIDITPEGLRIQIIDQDGEPMFPSGSAQMYEKTRTLLQKISGVINNMDNQISIRGHTDSSTYGPGASYTNWELSSDRANSTRRALKDDGIPAERLNNIMGKAATDPLLPDDPTNPQNRRISVILLREELTDPNFAAEEIKEAEERGEFEGLDEVPERTETRQPVGTFKRSPGAVDFP